jgi:hypothetical protein
MDRHWVLRKDYDPFSRALFPTILLRIFRCTVYRCPYCRWVFKATWGPSNALLGSGERACWKCKQIFYDGSHEWPEMSAAEHQWFLVPITVAGYLGALLVIIGLYMYDLLYFKKLAGHWDPILFVAFALPVPMWFIFRYAQVIRSIRRYNGRRERRP